MIRDDFKPYIDGNGLMSPTPVTIGQLQGSDNGPMYTGEYYVILAKQGVLNDDDKSRFNLLINNCMDSNGLLNRVPMGQADGQEQCDDYYGVLNACVHLSNTLIPRRMLWSTIKHLGFLNNVPNTPNNVDNWLIRQPQLLPCMIAASFPSLLNPIHWAVRLASFPLFVISSLGTILACAFSPFDDLDARRLSWHVMQITGKVSLLCKLASFIWLKRLYKDYGSTGMKQVAAGYYDPHSVNPYAIYWVTE